MNRRGVALIFVYLAVPAIPLLYLLQAPDSPYPKIRRQLAVLPDNEPVVDADLEMVEVPGRTTAISDTGSINVVQRLRGPRRIHTSWGADVD